MQSISPETIFRGNDAWEKSLPHITKFTKNPLILLDETGETKGRLVGLQTKDQILNFYNG